MPRKNIHPLHQFEQIAKGSFQYMPGMSVGAADSAHEVFFGVYNDRRVAIKPFVGQGQVKARHEMSMLRILGNPGGPNVTTFKPREIVIAPQTETAFLLTDYEEGLMSLAGLVRARNSHTAAEMVQLVGVSQLTELHRHGYSHGDAQVKNFGIGKSGTPMVYDLEKAGSEELGHMRTDPFREDVKSFVASLAYKAYGGISTDLAGDAVVATVLDPYVEALKGTLGEQAVCGIAEAAWIHHGNIHARQHDPANRSVYESLL